MAKKAGKKKRKGKIIAVLIILSSMIIGLIAGLLINLKINVPVANQTEEGQLPPELLSTEGFEKVSSIDILPPTLMLSTECYTLEMNITDDQLYSISYALKNLSAQRPLTHDLIKNMLENYDIEILQIKIDSVNENDIYKAKIILRQENKVLILDSRPSDATAISLRSGKDIWIKKEILEEFAVKEC